MGVFWISLCSMGLLLFFSSQWVIYDSQLFSTCLTGLTVTLRAPQVSLLT